MNRFQLTINRELKVTPFQSLILSAVVLLLLNSCSNNDQSFSQYASHFVNDSTIAVITFTKDGDDFSRDLQYISLNSQKTVRQMNLNHRGHKSSLSLPHSAYNHPYLAFNVGRESYSSNDEIQIYNTETGQSRSIPGISPIYVTASGRYLAYNAEKWDNCIYDFAADSVIRLKDLETLYIARDETYAVCSNRAKKLIRYTFASGKFDTLRTLTETYPHMMTNGLLVCEGTRVRQFVIDPADFESGDLSKARYLPQLWGNGNSYDINLNIGCCIQYNHDGKIRVYSYETAKMVIDR